MNKEELEADNFMQRPLKEDSEGHNHNINCFDEKELLPSATTDYLLIEEVKLTEDVDHDELSVPKKIHQFYFVRYPDYEDLIILKVRIEETQKLVQEKKEELCQITRRLKQRENDHQRASTRHYFLRRRGKDSEELIVWKLREVDNLEQCLQKLQRSKNHCQGRVIDTSSRTQYQFSSRFNHLPYKKSSAELRLVTEEVEYLQQCLQELGRSKNPGKRRDFDTFTPLEKQSFFTKSLNHRMQHGSNSLAEEKKLLRERKQFKEAEREKVTSVGDALNQAQYVPHYLGSKKDIRQRIELIHNELKILKKKAQACTPKMKRLEVELETAKNDVSDLRRKRDEEDSCIFKLEKQCNKLTIHHQNLSEVYNAKELARKKDVGTLKELSDRQVEKFMFVWNNNKTYRDDYVKKMSPSLEIGQLNRDEHWTNPK